MTRQQYLGFGPVSLAPALFVPRLGQLVQVHEPGNRSPVLAVVKEQREVSGIVWYSCRPVRAAERVRIAARVGEISPLRGSVGGAG